jgi:hypothetical protein
MIALVIVAFVIAGGIVASLYAISKIEDGAMFDAIYGHYDIRNAKCSVEDETSKFNVQISASEEPIELQVAVDQPIEIETESHKDE